MKRQARLLLDGVAAGWWIEEVLEAQRRVVLAPLLLPLRPRGREECDRRIRSSLEERDRMRKIGRRKKMERAGSLNLIHPLVEVVAWSHTDSSQDLALVPSPDVVSGEVGGLAVEGGGVPPSG